MQSKKAASHSQSLPHADVDDPFYDLVEEESDTVVLGPSGGISYVKCASVSQDTLPSLDAFRSERNSPSALKRSRKPATAPHTVELTPEEREWLSVEAARAASLRDEFQPHELFAVNRMSYRGRRVVISSW